MKVQKSIERALFDGDLQGPDWPVVDETGQIADPGNQDYGHTQEGRAVRLSPTGSFIGHVIDYQIPAVNSSTKYLFNR